MDTENLGFFAYENIKGLKGPLLIIANHRFCLDHFAFGAALPFASKIFQNWLVENETVETAIF